MPSRVAQPAPRGVNRKRKAEDDDPRGGLEEGKETETKAAEVAEAETPEAEEELEAEVAAQQTVACVVCYDRFPRDRGVFCREGHFLCDIADHGSFGSCLSGHVNARGVSLRRVNRLAALAAEAVAAGDTRRAQELGGAIFCPVPGCSAPPLSDVGIVRQVFNEAEVSRYMESRWMLPVANEVARVFEQAQTTLRAVQDEIEGRRLLLQQLVSHYPNGRQCGGCGFGPVGSRWMPRTRLASRSTLWGRCWREPHQQRVSRLRMVFCRH